MTNQELLEQELDRLHITNYVVDHVEIVEDVISGQLELGSEYYIVEFNYSNCTLTIKEV